MADPPSVGSGQPCGPEKFELERMPPEIVIVLDRSSSMSATDNRMTTRWAEATAALDDTLRSTEATVHWGLKMFPSMSGCGVTPGLDEGVRRESHAAITDRITTAGKPASTLTFEKRRWNEALTLPVATFVDKVAGTVPPKPVEMDAILRANRGLP